MRKPTNIREVAKLSPDYLGLIFYAKSPRYVDSDKASAILNALPKKAEIVGVFVNETLPVVIEKCTLFEIRTVQLHGNESPEYCSELKELGFTVIKAFGINEQFDFSLLAPYKSCSDYFLFDTKSKAHGGTGQKFDWRLLRDYDNDLPLFLSGGIGPSDAEEILSINKLNLFALDLNSKFETEPGIKNTDALGNFITTIRKN